MVYHRILEDIKKEHYTVNFSIFSGIEYIFIVLEKYLNCRTHLDTNFGVHSVRDTLAIIQAMDESFVQGLLYLFLEDVLQFSKVRSAGNDTLGLKSLLLKSGSGYIFHHFFSPLPTHISYSLVLEYELSQYRKAMFRNVQNFYARMRIRVIT